LSAERNARDIAENGWFTVLMTNSFHYLETFLFYLKKYEADDNIHFYLVKDGDFTTSCEPYDCLKSLSQPSANLTFAYELENENNLGELK